MADAAREYIATFRKRMIETDVARVDEIVGCSDEEMARIRAINPNVAAPTVYLAFMREMGRSSGNLFAGEIISYPECVDYQHEFHEFADEDPEFHPDQWFVFATHQGYQFYYFRDGDPRVYLHSEEEQNPFYIWDSFAARLESALEDEIPLAHRRRYGDMSHRAGDR